MNASTTGTPATHTFDPGEWLSQFESVGGGYTVSGDAMHLFVLKEPIHGDGCLAKAMLSELRPGDRAILQQYLESNHLRSIIVSTHPADGAIIGSLRTDGPEGEDDMNMMTRIRPKELHAEVAVQDTGVKAIAPISRGVWDGAMRDLEAATAAYRAYCAVFDAIDAAHTRDEPSEPMIDWSEFPMMDKFRVCRILDLDRYRERVLAERGRTWWGSEAVLERRMETIERVARYREALRENDRRHGYSAALERIDSLLDAMSDAENRLVADIPAPNMAALLWKLERLLAAEGSSTSSWSAEYVSQTISDMRHLLGKH